MTICSPRQSEEEGAEIRRAYGCYSGLEDLVKDTRRVAERGSIRAIDKRQIIVDKDQGVELSLTGVGSRCRKTVAPTDRPQSTDELYNHERYACT